MRVLLFALGAILGGALIRPRSDKQVTRKMQAERGAALDHAVGRIRRKMRAVRSAPGRCVQ